ncbi:MAG: hypothetical protein COV91_03590 [Candidatus Taylorbacteria bacterium CG11_big_fil_rev_8_21_14_0_20_46_11]|uniref:Glycosyltransferase 2-like domain-containing protein n=1 Tax=Candidatus Taylorbacteria bacterium CG11_big_fil_rev_8_21_14_0_20_46_11 TaxID=1975025 RepID=A0A2H0KB84_9BACT|nr:MAG: hypothetical protein COV91_03590 [Candidatus Taylorbacteria bacterium CG11_big_fil_rev_8_21_14_0_20_46_11]
MTASKTHVRLSIVVTVYSETFSVKETVSRLLKHNRGYIHEILLVVAPKSSRDSFEICHALEQEYPLVHVHVQKQTPGVGFAYREGMFLATGTHVALMSGDLETEPEAVDRMVKKIEDTGADVVIASRWLPGGGFVRYDKAKLVLNFLFQKMFRILYRTRLTDLTYGFKILSREVAQTIHWEGTLHEIFIETTVKPLHAGYRCEEVPSIWIGRKEGVSKNTFFRNLRYIRVALQTLLCNKKSL